MSLLYHTTKLSFVCHHTYSVLISPLSSLLCLSPLSLLSSLFILSDISPSVLCDFQCGICTILKKYQKCVSFTFFHLDYGVGRRIREVRITFLDSQSFFFFTEIGKVWKDCTGCPTTGDTTVQDIRIIYQGGFIRN